jgi:hypothetical protein
VRTQELLELVADRLPPDRLAEYQTLSFVGEWAVLINELSASLVNGQIPVTTAERDALATLLNRFRPITMSGHAYIRDQRITLASRNVG